MGYALLVLFVVACVVVWMVNRRPLTTYPRYKFNAPLPRLLRTGAVTCLGYCFVARSFIRGGHRAHEQHHHNQVIARGRWGHLVWYLWTLAVLFVRTKGGKVQAPNGRVYFAAYYDHPEEKAARRYQEIHAHTWPAIGRVSP